MIVHENKVQNNAKKASFEEAILATEFGKFNILLIIAIIPSAMSPVIDSTVMSYIVPAAQCDLNLSIQEKGMLNASVSIGMGILADTVGRRNVLLYAYVMDFLLNIISSFLQSFWFHFIFKFFTGFVISGPYGILMAYVAEFSYSKYRSKVILIVGLAMTFTLVLMPLLAWLIMPLGDLSLNQFVMHSWQLYMAIVSIPSLLSAIAYFLLPESPKYLMSIGRNDKALQIIKRMYRMNTGKPEDTYPYNELLDETNMNSTTFTNNEKLNIFRLINKGIIQLKPIWRKPYVGKIMLTIIAHFGILLGANTMRLWLPQLFTSIDEHNQLNGITNTTLCQVIDYSFQNIAGKHVVNTTCIIVKANDQVYINSIITAAGCFIASIFIIIIIKHCKKKYLLVSLQVVGGCTSIATYWSSNAITTLVLLVINVAFTIQSSIILMSLTVEIFPTNLRAMASSLTILAGQLGSLVGNLTFPLLLSLRCFAPFAFLGVIVIMSGLLCVLLPESNTQNFK